MAWAPASGRLLGPGSHGPPVSRSTVRPPRPDRWPHYGKPGADLLRLSRLEKGCPSWRPTGLAADPYGLAIPAGPSSAAAAGRRRSERASSQAPTAARAVTRSATSSVEGRGASAFRYAVSKRSEEPATAAGSPDRCRSASIALPAYGLSIMLSIVAATARHPHRENRLRPNACRSASHPAMSESSSDWSSRHAPQRRNIARAGWVILDAENDHAAMTPVRPWQHADGWRQQRLRPPEVGLRSPLRFRAGPVGRSVVGDRRVGAPGRCAGVALSSSVSSSKRVGDSGAVGPVQGDGDAGGPV